MSEEEVTKILNAQGLCGVVYRDGSRTDGEWRVACLNSRGKCDLHTTPVEDPRKLEAELAKKYADLKAALQEIEDRGFRIAALEGVGRGLADLVNETIFGQRVTQTPEEKSQEQAIRIAKAKQLLIAARTLEIF